MTVGFLANEGNTYNLEIQFGLRKPGSETLSASEESEF